jgi:hypothetical protein
MGGGSSIENDLRKTSSPKMRPDGINIMIRIKMNEPEDGIGMGYYSWLVE